MIQYQTKSVGENRGRPRIYLQGRQLEEAGFKVDERFNLEMFDGYLVIKRQSDGARKVSGKKKRTVPVIDINTERLLDALGTSEKVTLRYGDEIIVISTERTERQRRSRRPEPTEAALFAGGGLLSLAAHQAGFKTVWANEVSERYADIYERNLGGAMQVCSIESIETFPERVGLLTAGVPCEPFSRIRTLNKGSQTKRDKNLAPEAHELGDMVFWTLRAVDRAGQILQNALRRMGYSVEGRILDPSEYGELTGRRQSTLRRARARLPSESVCG
jgi:DNA (cytosine-5)-methyltransferase 1